MELKHGISDKRFEEIQKKIDNKNLVLFVSSSSKERYIEQKIETWLIHFFFKLNPNSRTCRIIDDGNCEDYCNKSCNRTMHDIYLLTKYHYNKNTTFKQVYEGVWNIVNMGFLNSFICRDIDKRVFFTEVLHSFVNDKEFEDEFGFNANFCTVNEHKGHYSGGRDCEILY